MLSNSSRNGLSVDGVRRPRSLNSETLLRNGFGEGGQTWPQSSGKPRRAQYTACFADAGSPLNTHDHAFMYSGSRHTALSQPAFEQCPLLGCAPTGPLRPSIGAHIKRPSHLHLRSGILPRTRLRPCEDRIADSELTKGISRWQALEREQFRALLDSPPTQGRSEGGSKPC